MDRWRIKDTGPKMPTYCTVPFKQRSSKRHGRRQEDAWLPERRSGADGWEVGGAGTGPREGPLGAWNVLYPDPIVVIILVVLRSYRF